MRNVSGKRCTENQNAHSMSNNFLPKIVPFIRRCGKIWQSRTGHRWQYTSNTKRAFPCWITKARIQTHTRTTFKHLLLFHNNGYANALECYVIRTLLVLSAFVSYGCETWSLAQSVTHSHTESDNRVQQRLISIELSDLWSGYRKLNYSLQSDSMTQVASLNPFSSSN